MTACSERSKPREDTLFTWVDDSGIAFENTLNYTEQVNPYTFKNFYNGGGVAVGDLNNDGLPEIFFAGNLVSNRLYLNKGSLQFEDITQSAGLSSKGSWSTGVTMVDLNADGFLDLYVCKSGPPDTPDRSNALFINNGDLTFTEQASKYGLDIKTYAHQAAFFDYDIDGDLDMFLLNQAMHTPNAYRPGQIRETREEMSGDLLFKNENGKFIDVSDEAS